MNLGRIIIAPVFPWWFILLLLGLGLASVITQYWLIRRRLSRQRSLGISLLRLSAIFLLISFSLNPTLVSRKEQKVSPTLSILFDTSQGMNLPAPTGKGSRLDEAKALLLSGPTPLLKSLAEKFDIKLYAIGESLKPFEAGELAGLKAGGKRGDLDEALTRLAGKSSLGLLLSDGNLTWEKSSAAAPPLVVIPMGSPEGYKDILIKAVKAPSLAFRGRPVPIEVMIKGYGYKGRTVPVLLKEGVKLLTAKSVRMDDSPGEASLSFSFTPEEMGHHNLSVSIPAQYGESMGTNNTANFSVKVVRDKIRVLLVSGSPSLNYRFMRAAFKNDPSIDLLSFVILRTPSDIMNVPVQEQSLIPFPVETLFSKDLKSFDLLIFDNFPYHLYFSPNYLENVREFITGGGGFAMIGGPNFSDDGKYAGTRLGEILPVRMSGREDYRRDSSYGVRLSRAGRAHPITRDSQGVGGDKGEHQGPWEEMPPLDGINLLQSKSSGTVLLETADGNSRPLLTSSTYGKGRVLVLATDYSWKWYMGMVAKGKGNWVYLRLMERMVRWLTKDPGLDPIQTTLPEAAGEVGQEMEVRIKVREAESSSSLRSAVSFSAFNPDGIKIRTQLKGTGQPGEYVGSFLPDKGGAYRMRVETPTGTLEESISIPGPMENLDGVPDHERLRAVAASTGGKILSAGDNLLKELEAYAGRGQNRFLEEKRLPLWGNPYVLVLILGLLAMEWYFRRRWGLV